MQESKLGLKIYYLTKLIRKQIEQNRDDTKFTGMQGQVLHYLLGQKDDCEIFQKDIEANFSIARSTATGILQLMEKKEYIHRETVPYDARLKQVMLTAKGEELQKNTMKAIRNLERKMRSGIPEEDMDTFFRVIRTIRANVENCHKETDRRRD